MTRLAAMLALVLLTAGCARMERNYACQREAGPEPGAGGHLFGAIGAAMTAAQPEHVAWQSKVDACMARTQQAVR
jgi:hypothetical protein